MKIKNHFTHFLLVFALFHTILTNAQTANTTWKTQINNRFSGINKTKIPHHLLIDYAMEFTELSAFNGSLTTDNLVHKGTYTSIYNTLLMARVQTSVTGLVNPTAFKNNWDNVRNKNTIVLSGLYYKYSKIKANAYPNYLTVANNKYYDKYVNGVWQNPYEDQQVFAITTPILKYKKLNLQVQLPNNLWYTNQSSAVQNIAIDFEDGNGYQTMAFGQIKTINYSQKGLYEWKYKLTLTNGQVLYSHSKISIEGEVAPNTTSQGARTINEPCTVDAFGIDTVEFVGTQTYLGTANTATLQIDYRAGSSCTITKPLIVAEGFESGLLGIENGLGDNHYGNFILEATNATGNLAGQITDYDIIYINWDNGKDYLQRNAVLLEDIITWVNSIKTGSTQNVVLGQSMGGVLARYALADMEQNGITHDTSLYISHDAPHQGANIPLSILYFARHMVDQFVSTPIGDMNINPSDGSPVSIYDIQTLINAPATQQLLIRNVNSGFYVTTALHDSWQADLQSKGYPQLTRNISLSNGSHCANPQNYNPSDTLFSLSGSGKTSLLGDFLLELLGPLTNDGYINLAFAFNEPGLLIGILPGKSKFDMNFNAKALPNVGQNTQIYKGKITFIKELFWIADININLTDRSYNNPSNSLSYDYYPGGQYRLPFNFENSTVDNWFGSFGMNAYMVNGFNFIPVPSALDVGSDMANLNDSDYLTPYTASNPPIGVKIIPFDNFMTSHQPNQGLNEQHISFNFRNGNWLALELNDVDNDEDLFDCSAFCNTTIGDDFLCNTTVYSVTDTATSVTWTVDDPNNLVTFTTNFNEITLSPTASNNSGYFTLNVTYSNIIKCGTNVISQQIWVGRPNVTSHVILGGYDNQGINSTSQLHVNWADGATEYYWFFGNVGAYTNCAPNDRPKFITAYGVASSLTSSSPYASIDWGNCTGGFVVNCKAVNDCGMTGISYKNVQVYDPNDNNPDPCNQAPWRLKTYPNPIKKGSLTVVSKPDPGFPCDERVSEKRVLNSVEIYNFYGVLVYKGNFKANEFTIEGLKLKSGHYALHVTSSNEETIRKLITVK